MKIWHSVDIPILPTLPQSLVKRAFLALPDGLALNLQFNSKPGHVSTLQKRSGDSLLKCWKKSVFILLRKQFVLTKYFSFKEIEKTACLKLTVSQKGTKGMPSIDSPSGRNTNVDFQIQFIVGKKQVKRRRKQIIIFALQTFLVCRTARQVETKLTQLELILNSKKAENSRGIHYEAVCCSLLGKKLRKKWGNVNSINHYTWFCPGYILFCGHLKDKSSDDNHFSTTGALNHKEKKTAHILATVAGTHFYKYCKNTFKCRYLLNKIQKQEHHKPSGAQLPASGTLPHYT